MLKPATKDYFWGRSRLNDDFGYDMKASQGLSSYLVSQNDGKKKSVVVGYDSRIKSDVFAKAAVSVFAVNGIKVHLWSELNPVLTVSYTTHYLHASAGEMITASHNPSKYNGYKVHSTDVKSVDYDKAIDIGTIQYIASAVMDSYIEEVKK